MPELTVERAREFVNYDQDTGVFTWRVTRGRAVKGAVVGWRDALGYIHTEIDGHRCLCHRLAWFMVYGTWPKIGIDHINGVADDNRISNLREAGQSINTQNLRCAQSNNRSGLLGAHWDEDNKKFQSKITAEGKEVFLGRFTTAEAAHAAYLIAKRQLHKGCTI
jgi:hypothetical protein